MDGNEYRNCFGSMSRHYTSPVPPHEQQDMPVMVDALMATGVPMPGPSNRDESNLLSEAAAFDPTHPDVIAAFADGYPAAAVEFHMISGSAGPGTDIIAVDHNGRVLLRRRRRRPPNPNEIRIDAWQDFIDICKISTNCDQILPLWGHCEQSVLYYDLVRNELSLRVPTESEDEEWDAQRQSRAKHQRRTRRRAASKSPTVDLIRGRYARASSAAGRFSTAASGSESGSSSGSSGSSGPGSPPSTINPGGSSLAAVMIAGTSQEPVPLQTQVTLFGEIIRKLKLVDQPEQAANIQKEEIGHEVYTDTDSSDDEYSNTGTIKRAPPGMLAHLLQRYRACKRIKGDDEAGEGTSTGSGGSQQIVEAMNAEEKPPGDDGDKTKPAPVRETWV